MNISLSDMHAVVTGGGSGIGAAIARQLDSLGMRLSLMGRSVDRLDAQCRDLSQACTIAADVTNRESVILAFRQARDTFGPVSILVNNAGAAASARFEDTDPSTWQGILDVNLNALFHCIQQVLGDMRRARWGRIINVASTAGLKGYPYVAAYCAAKHGAVGLTRSLALETARSGITVNALCPGYTRTGLLDSALENIMEKTGRSREDAEAELMSANPQQRFIEPREVAAAVAWLCQPGSEGITGQSIAIAGGEVMP